MMYLCPEALSLYVVALQQAHFCHNAQLRRICNRSDWFSQKVKTTVKELLPHAYGSLFRMHFAFFLSPSQSNFILAKCPSDAPSYQSKAASATFHRSRCQSRIFDAACRFMPRPLEAGHFLVSSADALWRYINSPRRH